MSLACLTCHLIPSRAPGMSPDHDDNTTHYRSPEVRCCGAKRNWSGELTRSPYAELRSIKSLYPIREENGCSKSRKKRQNDSPAIAITEPRLVRSGGVRRNWTFEELDERKVPCKC
ncbi:plant/protein [Carex rostrata]